MSTEVTRNDAESRYELTVDGQVVGVADYVADGERVVMPHTVVDPAVRGRGIAATLVRHALDDIRASGRTVVPSCWYVAEFIERNPAYGDLLAD